MNPQEILAKIAKLKNAILSESDPDVKATYQKKVAALETQIAEAEKKVEQKEEKAAVEEKKELSEAEQKIAKLKAAIATESDPDVKERYQKKIDTLQGTLKEVKEEIKEEKKEIAEQKKEIKEAIKEVKTAVKTIGQTEKKNDDSSAIKAKIAKLKDAIAKESDPDVKATYQKKVAALEASLSESEKQIKSDAKSDVKEVRKTAIKKDAVKKVVVPTTPLPARQAKRKTKLKSIISDLDALIAKNAKLKSKYSSDYKGTGKPKDLKRDAARSAKPFGYRFVGKHDYRVPTDQQIRKGLKRGTIDYEARPNRSDVFPKKTVKLADGGMAKGGTGSYKSHKIGDYVEVWQPFGRPTKLMQITGFEDGREIYLLKDKSSTSQTPKKYIANLSGEFPFLADGGQIHRMADKMTDAEYKKHLSQLNSKQRKTYDSLVRLGDTPKLALATVLLQENNEWDEATVRAYTMADGGMMADEFKKGGLAKGKLDAGVYRVGKPTKVSPILYEQKIVEIFENGDISTASDYGRKLIDFKSQKYPIISEEQLDAQYKMADGGMMAKGGTVKRDAIFHQEYGSLNEKGYPVTTSFRIYQKGSGLKEIKKYKDNPDYYVFEEKSDNKGIYHISFVEKESFTNYDGKETKSVISFNRDDLYAKGGTTKDEPKVIRGYSDDEAYEYAKGGMTSTKAQKIFEEYEENEDNNYHSENVVLLAKHFGTEEDLKDAKAIQKKHENMGHMPSSLMSERDALSKKLYPRLIAAKNKMARSDGGMMAKGGRVKKKVGFSKEDKARFAKPAGWRWKEEALSKKIIERKQLSMSPSKKMRDKYPDLVYYEDRLNKADKNPRRTSADSI